MSKAQIYADIEKKYEDTFDDFYTAMTLAPTEDYKMINHQFHEDIHSSIGVYAIPTNIMLEARGYSDMSFDEIEATIKEKYAVKT